MEARLDAAPEQDERHDKFSRRLAKPIHDTFTSTLDDFFHGASVWGPMI